MYAHAWQVREEAVGHQCEHHPAWRPQDRHAGPRRVHIADLEAVGGGAERRQRRVRGGICHWV